MFARLLLLASVLMSLVAPCAAAPADGIYLYVATPGIRNDLEYGGAGIVVLDVAHDFRFVKRIATPASRAEKPENIKGICAHAPTASLYFTTLSRLYRVDLNTEETLYEIAPPGGCDRLAMTPDGRWLYVPSLEGPHWHVVEAATGKIVKKLVTDSKAHNTIASPDGRFVYLAGLGSPVLSIADTTSQEITRRCGPFTDKIRPFTVNAAGTLVYVNVNGLLGFEIGDLEAGMRTERVEVQGFKPGKPKRHGCPSHGIALSPDEREIWVCDAANRRLHVFDVSVSPPKQGASIELRDEPGWVSFSLDGRRVYSSTGEVIDAATKQIVARLADEAGRELHSEKLLEIEWRSGKPAAAGNQFGIGRKGETPPENPGTPK